MFASFFEGAEGVGGAVEDEQDLDAHFDERLIERVVGEVRGREQ